MRLLPSRVPVGDRARYMRACAWAALASTAIFVALQFLDGGLFKYSFTSNFYDRQAGALLHLRLDLPQRLLSVEAFRHGGHWYMYFGPLPAILRLPVVLIFGDNGPYAQVFMTAAFVLTVYALARLGWRIREVFRPAGSLTTAECWISGLFLFSIATGSILTFLASQEWVYHEAILWGIAWTLLAFEFIVAATVEPSTRNLALAGAFAAAGLMSRGSVGMGPPLALGLLAVGVLVPPVGRLLGLVVEAGRRRAAFLRIAAASAAPVALYALLNIVKFGSPFSIPNKQQWYSLINPHRIATLAANHGSLFGLKFVPTNALQYLRPDAVQFSRLFPWIDFAHTAHIFGGLQYDGVEPTASITSSMPALSLLALVGLFFVLRPARPNRVSGRALVAPITGACAAAILTMTLAYIAQRYVGDFFPILALGAFAGFHGIYQWSATRSRGLRRGILGVVAAISLFAIAVNVALAIDYHYLNEFVDEGRISSFVHFQYTLASHLPGGSPPVAQGTAMPEHAGPRGALFELGNCDGLYWSQGDRWPPAERWVGVARTRRTGLYRFDAVFAPVRNAAGQAIAAQPWQPLLVRGSGDRTQVIAVKVYSSNRLAFGFASKGHDDLPHGPRDADGFFGQAPIKLSRRNANTILVTMDPNDGRVSVYLNGRQSFVFYQLELTTEQNRDYIFPTDEIRVGTSAAPIPTAPEFVGSLKLLPDVRPALCDLVRAHS